MKNLWGIGGNTAGLLTAALLLPGCVTAGIEFGPSSEFDGFQTVSGGTEIALAKETVWVQSREEADAVSARIAAMVRGKTISADTAVQVALLNNKGLQAAYAQIGIGAAELWQQSLPPNPTVSLGMLGIGAPDMGLFRAVEGMVTANILAMLTRDQRLKIADADFRAAQMRALLATLALAAETRRAWIEAVGAFETVTWLNQAQSAADAASELAMELGRTGAFSKSQQAREHAFFAELTGAKAEAVLNARLAKERLARLMGFWGEDMKFFVPDYLPPLPGHPKNTAGIETEAVRTRVDLHLARQELEAMALRYGLTDATRIVSDLELAGGLEKEIEVEDGKKSHVTTGMVEVEFAIPIFDSGKARLRKAELAYMAAANALAEKAVTVRSEARSAAMALKASHEIARHYQNAVLPLRTAIQEEALLTYNGMITNTFELLADIRARTNTVVMAAEARRNYWLAEAEAAAVVYGGSVGAAPPAATVAAAGDASPAH